ncbi:MAG: DUF2177 family protein [Oceanicaulis sp.]
MTLLDIAIIWTVTAIVFALLDLLWLGVVARGFYRSRIGPLLAANFGVLASVLFYLGYVTGAVAFGALAALLPEGLSWTFLQSWLFGLSVYGGYNLTNRATLERWPWPLALTDMAWGPALTGVSVTAGVWAAAAL